MSNHISDDVVAENESALALPVARPSRSNQKLSGILSEADPYHGPRLQAMLNDFGDNVRFVQLL